MELTRLRRYLRNHHTLPCQEACDLLDEIDYVYEDAQYYERRMADGSSLDDSDMTGFVGENAERLTYALRRVMGLENLLQVLASVIGYEKMQEMIGTLKTEWEEKERQSREELGELNDHPF